VQQGYRPFTTADALEILERVCAGPPRAVLALAVDLAEWRSHYPGVASAPLLSELAPPPAEGGAPPVAARFRALAPAERRGALAGYVAAAIASLTTRSVDQVALDRTLEELGLNSLTHVAL